MAALEVGQFGCRRGEGAQPRPRVVVLYCVRLACRRCEGAGEGSRHRLDPRDDALDVDSAREGGCRSFGGLGAQREGGAPASESSLPGWVSFVSLVGELERGIESILSTSLVIARDAGSAPARSS